VIKVLTMCLHIYLRLSDADSTAEHEAVTHITVLPIQRIHMYLNVRVRQTSPTVNGGRCASEEGMSPLCATIK
jgi:hypothetical protein